MKINVIVRGKTTGGLKFNDIVEELEIEDIDILRLAIKSVKGNYEDAVISEENCYIDGISEI